MRICVVPGASISSKSSGVAVVAAAADMRHIGRLSPPLPHHFSSPASAANVSLTLAYWFGCSAKMESPLHRTGAQIGFE